MLNPEDITDATTAMNTALILMAKAFKLNYSTPTKNNQRISSNPRNKQILQPGMNMGQDRQMQMVGGNDGSQLRQYAGNNVRNQNEYNAIQNVENQFAQNNPNGSGNVVAAWAKGNANGNNADLDDIKEVNANCILMANFQQASTSEAAKFVREFKSLEKVAGESLATHKALELEIERRLRAVVSQDIMSVVQNPTVVETSDLQTELERTKEGFENCIIKKDNEYAKLWNDWEDKFVLINKVRASVRTNPIIVLQPHVITKKDINSDSNGLSSTGVDNTAKTRRPQPRSNTKNNRVPSVSKSSCIKNKEIYVI
nr:hypothetical protein [Tanacetum cinerariifolium]